VAVGIEADPGVAAVLLKASIEAGAPLKARANAAARAEAAVAVAADRVVAADLAVEVVEDLAEAAEDEGKQVWSDEGRVEEGFRFQCSGFGPDT